MILEKSTRNQQITFAYNINNFSMFKNYIDGISNNCYIYIDAHGNAGPNGNTILTCDYKTYDKDFYIFQDILLDMVLFQV